MTPQSWHPPAKPQFLISAAFVLIVISFALSSGNHHTVFHSARLLTIDGVF